MLIGLHNYVCLIYHHSHRNSIVKDNRLSQVPNLEYLTFLFTRASIVWLGSNYCRTLIPTIRFVQNCVFDIVSVQLALFVMEVQVDWQQRLDKRCAVELDSSSC